MRIDAGTGADSLAGLLEREPALRAAEGWWRWPNVQEAHRRLARAAIGRIPPYPGGDEGRGVVIAAGGDVYFANAYVCARMLRHLGCDLPIQFWHHRGELDAAMRDVVAPLGVACVDAQEVEDRVTGRTRALKKGWELKPFALLYCPFREVMLLDADNVPVRDPGFLFDAPEFREAGAIFWPDYDRLAPTRSIWEICEVPYRDEPEFESGQIVVDRARCWEPLQLAMHYNDHSEFYYYHVHGDKETFHLAFRRLGRPYAMPSHPIHSLEGTMCQHDFEGRRLFQHRNMDKWRLDGRNKTVADFWYEDLCRGFLDDLRARWSGRAYWNAHPDDREAAVVAEVAGRTFRYTRVGYDERTLHLGEDGTIGEGGAERERAWSVNTIAGRVVLTILGESSPTCHLHRDDGAWTGRWMHGERMAIELQEIPT